VDSYIPIYLASQFLGLLVAVKMMEVFYEKPRASFKAMLLSILLIYFVFSFQHLFIRYYLTPYWAIAEIPIILVGYFVLTLNYESTIIKRVVAVISTFMILSFLIIPITLSLQALFPEVPLSSDMFIIMVNIAGVIFGYLVAILLRRFRNIRKNTSFPRIALIVAVSAAVMLLCFLFLGFASLRGMNIVYEVATIYVVVFVTAAPFLLVFLYDTLSAAYENKLKSALLAQEKEYYFTQCQLMQESAEQMKAFRHDIKSQLATLKDYSIKGKSEDIEDYLDSLLADIGKSETYSDTGNIAVDSIVNYKLKNVKGNNIKIDLRISIPPTLNVEAVDIVTILGNLLDNALDAVAKVDEKIIKLDIAFDKGGLFTKIENSFDGEVKYSEEQQILTSKGEDGHGYGLKNIRQSVEKYNGYMKLTHDGNIFSTVVFLYVGDAEEAA
jgi:sensor histidine kinase YesM